MGTTFTGPELASYTVSATTLADVVEAFSGDDEAGRAEWPQSLSYNHENGAVTSAEVTVAFRMTMPTWDGYDSASDAEKAEWDRFYGKLEEHENGHFDIARPFFEGIDQQMIGKTEAEAKQILKDAETAAQEASDQYDTSNDHGRNAGTTITVPAATEGD